MKSILDPEFRYTPSAATDLKKTFARIRREEKEKAEREAEYRQQAIARLPSIGRKRG